MASSKSTTRRILALWLPRLPTDRLQRRRKAARRTQGALDRAGTQSETPLVIAEKIDNALQISALDREASALGLKVGMTLASARAMLPELDVAQADADADRHTLERIASWCERFTPFVALSPPRTALLDITGCAHLFGGESALLASVTAGLIAQGFAVRAAIAGSAAAACALARYMDGAIAPPGADAALLAPLPVEALNLDPVTVHAFRRAGLKTIGAIAARGRAELTARFGAELVFLLEQALGRTEKPITPRRPLPDFSAEHRFAEPVVTEAAALAALEELARALCLRLERHARGARHIEARFFRTDGAVRTIAIETAGPSRDPGMILRLFQEKLGALADPLDPGFGYDLIRLCAARTERAGAEATDFDAQAHAAREVRFLVDRLTARFGKARVLVFEPRNTHIPERAFATVPAQEVSAYGCLSLPSICLARPCAEHPEPQTHVLAATGSSGQARGRQSCVSVSNNLALAVQVQQKNPPSLWEGIRDRNVAAAPLGTWERLRGPKDAPRRPLRLFAPPEPIDATAPVPDEPPVQFRWRRVLHAVAFAEGPERIAPEWWRHPGATPSPTRDYFRVEDSQGRRFWLYREGLYGREMASPRWFVHGLFA